MRDDEAIDRILHPRLLAGEPPRHRMRPTNPQVEADRLYRMLRKRPALQFLDSLIDGRNEHARNRQATSPGLVW
jgi:hypothetical protein